MLFTVKRESFGWKVTLSNANALDGTNNNVTGFKITGNNADRLGASAANIGDVNGDGIDDFAWEP